MLEIANLEVVYNDVVLVLRGLSLEVRDGQIVALLGGNGAGKTTTLRAITGLLDIHEGDITKGTIVWNGEKIHDAEASHIVRAGIAQVMEGRRIFAEMTVDDNLRTGSVSNKSSANVKGSFARVMELFPPLQIRRKDIAGYLSGGEQQMLAIGRALMTDPKLILMDEPSLGLSPIMCREIAKIIRDLHQAGRTIVVVEQNARLALALAQKGYVLETGRIALEGDAKDLRENEQVKRTYLGM